MLWLKFARRFALISWSKMTTNMMVIVGTKFNCSDLLTSCPTIVRELIIELLITVGPDILRNAYGDATKTEFRWNNRGIVEQSEYLGNQLPERILTLASPTNNCGVCHFVILVFVFDPVGI
jgi:hypothetical protein